MSEQITIPSGPFTGETGELVFRYSDGSADVRFPESGITEIPREHMPPAFDAYAWPGGYPIAYYADGSIICAECAAKDYADDGTTTEGFALSEAHHDEVCDGCGTVIMYQNWCDFCQDSVDVDEDHPHVCRPLKWQVWTQYRNNPGEFPEYPSLKRCATREQARSYARSYRRIGYAIVRVSPIVPPILPE
jgi:hypothetical protein